MIKDIAGKKDCAKVEFDHWNNYLETRKAEINQLEATKLEQENDPDYAEAYTDAKGHYRYSISPTDHKTMKEFFDRFKDRKTHMIHASKMTEYHGEYSKIFRFNVPLHPKNLS